MDNTDTYLALVALFTQPPNEITTMGAKRRLPQKRRNKLVCIHLMHPPLHGTPSLFHSKPSLHFSEFPCWTS